MIPTQQDILDNVGLVRRIVNVMKLRHSGSLLDEDDMFSEGIFGLFKAFELYDPKKSSFRTFANRKIRYAILEAHSTLFKQYAQAKKFGLPEPTNIYLDACAIDGYGSPKHEFIEGEYVSEEEIVEKLDSTLAFVGPWEKLTYRQRHIIKLMRRGLTQGEVSDVLKISPCTVSLQYHKAIKKIRDYHSNYRRKV